MYKKLENPYKINNQDQKGLSETKWEMIMHDKFDFDHNKFFIETGFDFLDKNFNGYSKIAFLADWKDANTNERKQMEDLAKNFGKDAINTFLITAHDKNWKDKNYFNSLLKISQLDQELAKDVFKIFSSLTEMSNYHEFLPDDFFQVHTIDQANLARNIHKKSWSKLLKNLIILFEEIQDIINSNKNTDITSLLSKKIEQIKPKVTILTSLIQTYKKNDKNKNLEFIKDMYIEVKPLGQELSEDEEENEKIKQDIISIAEKNYQKIFTDKNGRVNKAAVRDIINDLKKNLDNIKDQRAYLLKYKDEVIAFCRFEPISDTEVYAGSFNIYDDLKACGIGKYFSDRALAEEAKEHIIKIKFRADNPCNKMYEQQGFVEEKRVMEKRGNLDIEYIYYKMDKREKNTQEDKIAA